MKYIDKIPTNPFKARENKKIYGYGSVAHASVEIALGGGTLPSDIELAAKAGGMQHVDNLKKQVKDLQKKVKILGLGDAKSEVPFLCYLHHPEHKEDRLDVPMFGILDLSSVAFDGKNYIIKFADLKSGAAKWGLAKCLRHYQFREYAYAGWALGGVIPRFDTISLVREDRKNEKDACVRNQPVDFKMNHLIQFYEETKEDMRLLQDIRDGNMPMPSGKVQFFCPYPETTPRLHGKAE